MSKQKNNKLTFQQKDYQKFAQQREIKPNLIQNCIRAFLVGGLICTFGQGLQWFFINFFEFTKEDAGNPTGAVLIIISALLTSFGIYDHFAQWAGAGTIIPVTGFANTMTSAAIEHKSEGYVLGVGGNMFKISGSVITFGVFSAFIVAIIKIILLKLGAI